MNKKYSISIENLHLVAGFSLILSGVLVYFIDGIEMSLSWMIFGAMYISMSDIGEEDMTVEKQNHRSHKNRRAFGYLGAGFSLALLCYYLYNLLH